MTKETRNSKPTIKQRLAFAKIAEKGRSVSAVMREVGYSKQTAVTPHKLTESKGWKQLMEEFLPDSLLAEKHQALLNKKETIITRNNITKETETILTEEIDANAVGKGLDMAYKIKGAYKEDNQQKQTKVIINIEKQEAIDKALEDI